MSVFPALRKLRQEAYFKFKGHHGLHNHYPELYSKTLSPKNRHSALYNPSIRETETERLPCPQGQPGLQSETLSLKKTGIQSLSWLCAVHGRPVHAPLSEQQAEPSLCSWLRTSCGSRHLQTRSVPKSWQGAQLSRECQERCQARGRTIGLLVLRQGLIL